MLAKIIATYLNVARIFSRKHPSTLLHRCFGDNLKTRCCALEILHLKTYIYNTEHQKRNVRIKHGVEASLDDGAEAWGHRPSKLFT
jgi:hypothetical protein